MGEPMERRLQLVRGTDGWIAHLEWRGQWLTALGRTEADALRNVADLMDAWVADPEGCLARKREWGAAQVRAFRRSVEVSRG